MMLRNIKTTLNEFHDKHRHSRRYMALLWLARVLFLVAKATFTVAIFLFSFLIMRRAADFNEDTPSAFVDDDRTPDDIWKMTSGNDYYDKEPPDSFS